jgi:nucleoside-diphosphate-sugar epimerase
MSNPDQHSAAHKHIVVVGAGQIGTPLVSRLVREDLQVTWVSRTRPRSVPQGVRHVALDASDPAALARAAAGAHALIAAVNPAVYDARVWADTLPPLQRGLIEAAGSTGARLVLLDALYLYTTREGPLSPSTRQAPETEKGKIRKQLADMLGQAQRAGQLRATVLRAPDFWGTGLSSALLTQQALDGMRTGKRPLLIGNPDVPHAFSHRDDVVEALVTLALAPDEVEGQVFHAPVIHVTPRELVAAFGESLGVGVRPFVAPRWLLRLVGMFSASVRGLVEMLPQWSAPYLVDDASYCQRFGVRATSLAEGAARVSGERATRDARSVELAARLS